MDGSCEIHECKQQTNLQRAKNDFILLENIVYVNVHMHTMTGNGVKFFIKNALHTLLTLVLKYCFSGNFEI